MICNQGISASGSGSSLTSLEDDVGQSFTDDYDDGLATQSVATTTITQGSMTPLTTLTVPEERDAKRMRFE